MKYFLLLLVGVIATISCTRDRTNLINAEVPAPTPLAANDTLPLVLNEFVASGSAQVNEYGTAEDWIEIYNRSSKPYVIAANTWTVTDDSTQVDKYFLPSSTVPANGYLIVWCDLRDAVNGTNVHTNFRLSSTGELVGIGKRQNGVVKWIDKYAFGQQTSGMSEGRLPNGTGAWTTLTPTFGTRNQ